MPFGDGTGPMGMGPMTGRGAGYCAGFGQPGFASPMPGRGWFGRGRAYGYPYATPYAGSPYPVWPRWGGRLGGMGRGRGRRFFAPYPYPW